MRTTLVESLVESKLDYKTLCGLGTTGGLLSTYLEKLFLYFLRVLFYGDRTLLTKDGF